MIAAALEDDYDSTWGADAIKAIEALAKTLPQFSSDDLRRVIRKPPKPAQYGAAFRNAQSMGLIEAVGHGQSSVKTRNHGTRKVWTRKQEGVAR